MRITTSDIPRCVRGAVATLMTLKILTTKIHHKPAHAWFNDGCSAGSSHLSKMGQRSGEGATGSGQVSSIQCVYLYDRLLGVQIWKTACTVWYVWWIMRKVLRMSLDGASSASSGNTSSSSRRTVVHHQSCLPGTEYLQKAPSREASSSFLD